VNVGGMVGNRRGEGRVGGRTLGGEIHDGGRGVILFTEPCMASTLPDPAGHGEALIPDYYGTGLYSSQLENYLP